MNADARSKRNVAARQRFTPPPVTGNKVGVGAGREEQTRHADAAEARKTSRESGPPSEITPAEHHRMVAEAAYFRAERRAFAAGGELDDWVQAETEIDQLMQSGGSHARRASEVA